MKMNAKKVESADDVKLAGSIFLKMAGGWHFLVVKCEEGDGFFDFHLEVLNGTCKDMIGAKMETRCYMYEKEPDEEGNDVVKPELLRFALVTGLVKPKTERDVNFEKEAPGCTFIAKTYMKKATEKDDEGKWVPKKDDEGKRLEYCRLSYADMWSIEEAKGHDYASTIPLGKVPDGTTNGHANGNGNQEAVGAAAGKGGGNGSSEWDLADDV